MSLGLLLDCLTQFCHDSSGGKRFYTHEIKLLATKKRRKALNEHLVEPLRSQICQRYVVENSCGMILSWTKRPHPMVTIFAFFYVC